jgi:rfaE bifunctional protein kinase chain/domain
MRKKILVVGDVMVDKYVYVSVRGQAEEAPISVWDEERREYRLGGAANVANNLKAIGGDEVDVYLVGIASQYDRDEYFFGLLKAAGIIWVCSCVGPGMMKTRYVNDKRFAADGGHAIVFRSDTVKRFEDYQIRNIEEDFECFDFSLYDAVVFSDYDKGTITPKMVDMVRSAGPNGPLVVVDSKRLDLSMYRGADVLKINELEYSRQVSEAHGKLYRNVEELFRNVVVTLGKKGAELRQNASGVLVDGLPVTSNDRRVIVHAEKFQPVATSRVVDVTGCGDTHTAAMTFCLLKNDDIRMAVNFANACASNVVDKFGTSVPANGL